MVETGSRVSPRTGNAIELKTLCDKTDWALACVQVATHWPDTALKPKPKQKYERKRRKWRRNFYNSIEYNLAVQEKPTGESTRRAW